MASQDSLGVVAPRSAQCIDRKLLLVVRAAVSVGRHDSIRSAAHTALKDATQHVPWPVCFVQPVRGGVLKKLLVLNLLALYARPSIAFFMLFCATSFDQTSTI